MNVSASRYRARRLAIMIDASGIDVDPPCANCLRAHRRCVAASFSRRCSECVARSSSCPLSSTRIQAIPNSGVCVEREVALRLEVAQLLARLRACLSELDSLDRSRTDGSHTLGLSQGS
jgi:ribosomal protein L32